MNPKEAPPENLVALAEEIRKVLRKYLPEGYAVAKPRRVFGEWDVLVAIGLIGDLNDVSNRIRENDPLLTKFLVNPLWDGTFEVELPGASFLYVNPKEGSYLAMDRVRIPFRKFKGDERKILAGFERHMKRVVSAIKDNKSDIYRVDRIPSKYLNLF